MGNKKKEKNILNIFVSLLVINFIYILPVLAEDNTFNDTNDFMKNDMINKVKTNFSFGYDYNFGFSKIDKGLVSLDKNNNLLLDDRFRNTLYINDFDVTLRNEFLSILSTNVSLSIVSNGFNAEPLITIDSFKEYNKFLNDRKNNIKTLWQRFFIIKDVNFEVKDPTTKGKLVIGQQSIPFNYDSNTTLNKPVSFHPSLTPMTDLINFNLKKETELPYQNSTLTNARDLGFMLTGNYQFFRFYSGVYNGAGPNIFDDNNEKDLFGRLDIIINNFELGISHLRGKHTGFKNIFDKSPERLDIETAKTGLHSKIGTPNFYLLGDYTFYQDNWNDKTVVDKNGWYVELVGKAEKIVSGSLRFENFYDSNVLLNKEKNVNYNIKRFVANFSQNIGPNIISKQEYSHTWEDLNESKNKYMVNYGIASVNLQFIF
ncbi:MAG: hypothetical protein AABZ74_00670 [Cyanobacteriota bacterium]